MLIKPTEESNIYLFILCLYISKRETPDPTKLGVVQLPHWGWPGLPLAFLHLLILPINILTATIHSNQYVNQILLASLLTFKRIES